MFGFFSKDMTERSNHYVDWSRVGELLKSGTHRYSKDELLARGGIVLTTAVSAYLGAYLNNTEKTQCSNTTMAISAGMIGFVVSHAVVILPLVKKRLELERECKTLVEEIEQKLNLDTDMTELCKNNIRANVSNIMTLSLSDEKHARASQTWGRRKHLLQELNEQLPEKLNNSLAFSR